MTDPEFYIKQPRLGHLLPPNQPKASKFYTQFIYKAVVVAIFLVILLLFPSQAPEFINQSLHSRSWELVQLLLVGIAVSYGLFSRRNDETVKEHSSTFDNAQSYVSRLLQVSSVFDDDSESPSVSDENKVQTWSSQYFRGEPVVGVAQQNPVTDEKQSGSASRVVVDKPLLLPIRSLKSRVTQPDFSETANESSGKGGSLSKSSLNSGSKSFSSNSNRTRNGEVAGSIPLDTDQLKAEENVVLRSPIPWRSRSGRMEMKEETDDDDGVPLYSLPPSMEESDFNRLRSQSKPSPMSISSLKNTFSSQSSPPPAPPPPPPLYVRKPPLVKSNSTLSKPEDFPARELKRSAWSVTKELINGAETGEMQNRANSGAESRPRVPSDGGSLMGKSVQTIRLGKPIQEGLTKTGFVDYEWEAKKQEFEENVAMETDEESESEDQDLFDGGSENDNENEEVVSNNVGDVGKDVDKKADEFIAKFREQIRLQRIESIKRSTGLIAKNSNR
ncbi:uncharacterized protein LOC131307361 [Rhododendron vialii]|uniref:uncharacterized protein LOC131307361 n=1 Tax=Rhododendron vialii TaxID=182163 RepID=UPI00265D8EC0|nr:uncharacterized protein LOC131307361 [Rhododendron vialii]